ncbi:hypothetical protein JCM11641_002402 [Rhodosporidiobolus odoratus]
MSSVPPSNSAAQRRSLNDLPVELKAKIVQIISSAESKAFRAMQGRTISALFRVSKQYSALAAPHLFQKLKTSAMDVHFKCTIAKSRLPLFAELRVDTTGQASPVDIIALLPSLRSLRSLDLNYAVLQNLFGGPFTLDPPQSAGLAHYAASAFKSLRIVKLRHFECDFVHTAELIELWSNSLRTVKLRTIDFAGLARLGVALSRARGLKDLCLNVDSGEEEPNGFDISPLQLTTGIPPRKLKLKGCLLHISNLSFAHTFSASLTSLNLDLTCPDDNDIVPFAQPVFTVEVFPHVVTLVLKAECYILFKDTFASIRATHFPGLISLTLTFPDLADWTSDSSPLVVFPFPSFPALEHLVIKGLSRHGSPTVDYVQRFCRDRDLCLGGDALLDSSSATLDAAADGGVPSSTVASLHSTLQHAASEIETAQARGDGEALAHWRKLLKPLEVERVAAEA